MRSGTLHPVLVEIRTKSNVLDSGIGRYLSPQSPGLFEKTPHRLQLKANKLPANPAKVVFYDRCVWHQDEARWWIQGMGAIQSNAITIWNDSWLAVKPLNYAMSVKVFRFSMDLRIKWQLTGPVVLKRTTSGLNAKGQTSHLSSITWTHIFLIQWCE